METDAFFDTPVSRCPGCGALAATSVLEAPDRFHGRQQLYRLVRCASCELIRTDNPPSPERIADHYGDEYDQLIADVGDSEIEARWGGPRERLMEHVACGEILDLGCSSGGFLSSLMGRGWGLHGIEMSKPVADRAKAKTGADIHIGDVLQAPYLPNSFDAITCFHVFEHMYQPREVLIKVREWLKPGGVFLVYLPNIDSAGARIFKSYWYGLELPRHLVHFSPVSLRSLAGSVGLEEVRLQTSREVFVEPSCRYIVDDCLRTIGVSRLPLASSGAPGVPFRVLRKAFRLTVLPALDAIASLAGDGEIIQAVFRKPRV